MDKGLLSPHAQQIRAYSRQHQNHFLALALAFLSFTADFSRLEGTDRAQQWVPKSQKQYLHIILHLVDKASRGRHNQLSFTTARLGDIDMLPGDSPGRIRSRLERRFPSICLGYSVVDTQNDLASNMVTTYTHTFQWPAPGFQPPRIIRTVRWIWLNEWILQQEASAAEIRREREKVRK